MITHGKLMPEKLVGELISLEDSLDALAKLDQFNNIGMTVINKFNYS